MSETKKLIQITFISMLRLPDTCIWSTMHPKKYVCIVEHYAVTIWAGSWYSAFLITLRGLELICPLLIRQNNPTSLQYILLR